KSTYACAFANEVKAERKLGFLLNEDGKIIPANKSAMYNYRMGIDDKLKFRENQRTGIEITHETFELDYQKDEYIFNFTEEEKSFIENYKSKIGYNPSITYIGFNTGCSTLFPNKKMTIEQHVEIIKNIIEVESIRVVLLGGKEDTERNEKIFNSFPKRVQDKIINTPTTEGLRKGACYMSLCDIVVSGDSFGMHLAIALKKYVIAWFGLSCWTEIELYGRGEKLLPANLECAPCWNKVCPNNLECIDLIDLNKISELILKFEKHIEPIQI
ncbi:MAG: lipopolysaccharide heptosyltransferase family protein, partial [Ignavibacteria bacterium]|nr:lipopolysaccharide heptosyltransferase family protein [Ignavibacteria bacterium]